MVLAIEPIHAGQRMLATQMRKAGIAVIAYMQALAADALLLQLAHQIGAPLGAQRVGPVARNSVLAPCKQGDAGGAGERAVEVTAVGALARDDVLHLGKLRQADGRGDIVHAEIETGYGDIAFRVEIARGQAEACLMDTIATQLARLCMMERAGAKQRGTLAGGDLAHRRKRVNAEIAAMIAQLASAILGAEGFGCVFDQRQAVAARRALQGLEVGHIAGPVIGEYRARARRHQCGDARRIEHAGRGVHVAPERAREQIGDGHAGGEADHG